MNNLFIDQVSQQSLIALCPGAGNNSIVSSCGCLPSETSATRAVVMSSAKILVAFRFLKSCRQSLVHAGNDGVADREQWKERSGG